MRPFPLFVIAFLLCGRLSLAESLALFGLDHFVDVNEMILSTMPAGCLRHYFLPPFFPTLTSTIVIVSFPKMSTTFTAIFRRPGVHS
jgi:hypothetical protein